MDTSIVAAIVAMAAPVTAAVVKGFELALANSRQKHEIALARAKQEHEIAQATAAQNHKITTEYLDRALNPATPLATRHALLRFLATKASDSARLQQWASAELEEVGRKVAPFDHKVDEALMQLESAKNPAALREAEAVLKLARGKRDLLLSPPQQVTMTPSAVKAGFFAKRRDLHGMEMIDQDLAGADLIFAGLMNANFSGSDLRRANFQGADLRAATFQGAKLGDATFYGADCRGTDFTDACLTDTNFRQARLEGAILRGADLTDARLQCSYDATTIWPDGFDPEAAGAANVVAVADMAGHQSGTGQLEPR